MAEQSQNHWSLVDGDGHETWFDSLLSDTGVKQVQDLGKLWIEIIDKLGVPLPEALYTSPLARTLQTTEYVFAPLTARHGQPFRPVVKEKLRERWTMHTCDCRRTRTWIQENWPRYAIEAALAEEDPFPAMRRTETEEEHVARKQAVLEDIFSTDESAFVSLTVHRYAIEAILTACNAAVFKVREGVSLAMLVRGERLDDVSTSTARDCPAN